MSEVPPVPAPAVPATPSPVPVPAVVTLPKEQHDGLVRDAGRAAANQRKADLYDKLTGGKGGHFKPAAPVTPPSPEEEATIGAAEDRKAERGLFSIAADPAFRDVLDADPTLRSLFTSNPLAVLPMLAPDALDADDALSLVKEALGKRRPAPAPVTPPTPPAPVPPVGAVNPSGDKAVNEEVEVAKKNPNTERAVAGMIGAKLRGFKK